jgi:hypothetical protein
MCGTADVLEVLFCNMRRAVFGSSLFMKLLGISVCAKYVLTWA